MLQIAARLVMNVILFSPPPLNETLYRTCEIILKENDTAENVVEQSAGNAIVHKFKAEKQNQR